MAELISILRSIERLLQENNQLLRKLISEDSREQQLMLEDEVLQSLQDNTSVMMNNAGSMLFARVTYAYLEEELEKRGNKKSARRLSINLGKTLADYFQRVLPDEISVESIDSLLVFKGNGVPFAAVRFFTDLGYCRGRKFYEVIDDVVNKCVSLGIQRDSVFIIICSLWNSLDKNHVEDTLHKRVRIKDVLSDRSLLIRYLKLYISKIESLESPYDQIYFMGMGEEVHPNLKANELRDARTHGKSEEEILLEIANYPWLSPIDGLILKLEALGKRM